MKKSITLFIIFAFALAGAAYYVSAHLADAQGMMGQGPGVYDYAQNDHTKQEEAEGKAIWQKFQAKEKICADLTDDDFGALGEYFMGNMLGDAHAAMNAMITQMHGEEGEKQIHVAMGKRFSGCDTVATYPAGSFGFMPMMMGGWSSSRGDNFYPNHMMNFGYGILSLGFLGMLLWVLWWVVVVAVIVWLVKKIFGFHTVGGSSALDILKERYAKGEIDKKEFDEKKKDLV